jgi:hypothetical protein
MQYKPICDIAPSLVTMEPAGRRVITYLRLLRSAPAGRGEVEQDIAARGGLARERPLEDLERMERLMTQALDRTLDIGGLYDSRATADEVIIAGFIAAAAEGRFDACRRKACEIVGPARAEPLVDAVRRAARGLAAADMPRCSCGRTSADRGSGSHVH